MDPLVMASDLLRYANVLGGTILAGLMFRISWRRMHQRGKPPHAALSLSFGIGLVLLCARRLDNLGQPGDAWLWGATVVVVVGLYGASRETRIYLVPPWLRSRARDADEGPAAPTRH